MSQIPKYFDSGHFPRSVVQDMLDEAQLDAGSRFAGILRLRDPLQNHFREALENCNYRQVDPMEILHGAMFLERTIMNAYNEHGSGNGMTRFHAQVLEPDDAVGYEAQENIPETLDWFPLRAAVFKRGVPIQTLPIVQVEEPAETHQQNAPRRDVASKAPARINGVQKKAKAKESGGVASAKYNKLRDAPSPWLSFPAGNLTMAEIMAFIPQAIKSVDVIDRFLYNGALSPTLAEMINHYRTMPNGPVETNTIYRMMKAPMDARAKTEPIYQGWTVTKHITIPRPADFDPTSLSVAGFRTPQHLNPREAAVASGQLPPTILFRDMANGVKIMPSGYDALDLTRCIEYCIEHEDEDWCYPQDFTRLVSHLGGATAVDREHRDTAAIARHTSVLKPNHAGRPNAGQPDNESRLKLVGASTGDSDASDASGSDSDEESGDGEDEEEGNMIAVCINNNKRKRIVSVDEVDEGFASRLPKHHKKDAPSSGRKVNPSDTDSESDSDVYVEPRDRKKVGVATRKTLRNRRFTISSYKVHETFDSKSEHE